MSKKENKEPDLQELLYKAYLKSLGDEVLEVVDRKPPKVGQVRFLLVTPPEWILIADKPEEDLWTVIPLTTNVRLAITNKYPPVVTWKHFRMVPLPFWVYSKTELLEKYSKPVFKIREEGIQMIKEYVSTARTKGIGKWREKFIQKVADRFADFFLSSMLAHTQELENKDSPKLEDSKEEDAEPSP